MADKTSNEAKARVPVKDDTLSRLRDYSHSLGVSYDDTINYLINHALNGADTKWGEQVWRGKQLPDAEVFVLAGYEPMAFYPGKPPSENLKRLNVRVARRPTLEWFNLTIHYAIDATDKEIIENYENAHKGETIQMVIKGE